MEVAAGDDSTLTCTATGYPEVTISFQISGLSASYTEGIQSTVTIATPTVPFNVSRSITVSNVTIADCDAVITCTAENTNSSSRQNTSGSVTIQVLGKKLIYVTQFPAKLLLLIFITMKLVLGKMFCYYDCIQQIMYIE